MLMYMFRPSMTFFSSFFFFSFYQKFRLWRRNQQLSRIELLSYFLRSIIGSCMGTYPYAQYFIIILCCPLPLMQYPIPIYLTRKVYFFKIMLQISGWHLYIFLAGRTSITCKIDDYRNMMLEKLETNKASTHNFNKVNQYT
jgi:hypothetical protein